MTQQIDKSDFEPNPYYGVLTWMDNKREEWVKREGDKFYLLIVEGKDILSKTLIGGVDEVKKYMMRNYASGIMSLLSSSERKTVPRFW